VIVFVTDELPRPGSAGHLALNCAIIDWLRGQGYAVHVLFTGQRLASPVERYATTAISGPHISQIGPYVVTPSPVAAFKVIIKGLLKLLPAGLAARLKRTRYQADAVLGAFPSFADLRWCARAVQRLKPAAVFIDTIFRAPLLAEPELAEVKSIIITHDVFHRRTQALNAAGYKVRPEHLTRAREAALLSRASAVAAIQPDEAEILAQMCPGQQVVTVPMPAIPCPPPLGQMRVPGRLIFVGSASLPNLDGLRWFFTDIWPLLPRGALTLDLVGDCGPALHRLPEGVRVLGRVPSLTPLLHRAALAISPLRAGSGLKIKLLDYARHGLVTVATPASLQGFYQDPEAPFVQAESAKAFAQTILRLAATPPLPDRALTYATRHYGTETSFAGLAACLRTDDELVPQAH
jgi:hypothetical protein